MQLRVEAVAGLNRHAQQCDLQELSPRHHSTASTALAGAVHDSVASSRQEARYSPNMQLLGCAVHVVCVKMGTRNGPATTHRRMFSKPLAVCGYAKISLQHSPMHQAKAKHVTHRLAGFKCKLQVPMVKVACSFALAIHPQQWCWAGMRPTQQSICSQPTAKQQDSVACCKQIAHPDPTRPA